MNKKLTFGNKMMMTPTALALGVAVVALGITIFLWRRSEVASSQSQALLELQNEDISKRLEETSAKLELLESEDQKVINDQLKLNLKDLQVANAEAIKQYERLLGIREDGAKTVEVDKTWATILSYLSKNNYASASAELVKLKIAITEIEKQLAQVAALKIPNVAVNNQAPGSGFSQQKVETPIGPVVISLIAADLGSTRVIVDTASSSDCRDGCPVLPLADYVARNGAFAGVNGTYFCPASYPSCAGKTNSFDLLVMNKDKTYFNSDNNVYSNNPAVIFSSGSIRFVSAASQWGRDTSVDGVISNFPLLLSGGEVRFSGDGDPKKGSKGNRSFVANKGNTVYIGVVHGATVAEGAIALKTLGMDNAMNLDSGGSTALWSGGYKVGPGRAIPNAVLFVRR